MSFIVIKNNKGLAYLKHFIRDMRSNTLSYGNDKNGHPLIKVGYNSKPDSDWGKYTPHATIFAANRELYQEAVSLIRRECGWETDRDLIVDGRFPEESEAA